MNIITGKIPSSKKVLIYGPEGIGKSTFAAQFPQPVFIDTEGSTKDMDVARFEKASSWQMLMDQIRYVRQNPSICRTLVIDTVDWAEQMCVADLCARYGKKGVEDFGYGNGYVYAKEEFGRFLNALEEVVEAGVNVVLTAHAQMRKFEQPDEMGSYDRWELKLGKKTSSQTAPLAKEWADMVLFANYKTIVVNVDGQGSQKGKNKAQGGKRVMYTSHHPCWDAKNRYGLPEEVPFEYASIRSIIEPVTSPKVNPVEERKSQPVQDITNPVQQELPLNQPASASADTAPKKTATKAPDFLVLQYSKEENVPKALMDLMVTNRVTEWDIQNVVGERGYFPTDMPIEKYPEDFVQGCLVGAWSKVYAMILENRKTLDKEIPFN